MTFKFLLYIISDILHFEPMNKIVTFNCWLLLIKVAFSFSREVNMGELGISLVNNFSLAGPIFSIWRGANRICGRTRVPIDLLFSSRPNSCPPPQQTFIRDYRSPLIESQAVRCSGSHACTGRYILPFIACTCVCIIERWRIRRSRTCRDKTRSRAQVYLPTYIICSNFDRARPAL